MTLAEIRRTMGDVRSVTARPLRRLIGAAAVKQDLTLEQRFWTKVEVGLPDDCWLWTGGAQRNGYGAFAVRHGLIVTASRMSWVLAHGTIPDGLWVLHRCDNPPCVNPAHLFLGTRADNIRDMMEKGRHWAHRGLEFGLKGELNHKAKLTEDQVREIRERRARGETTVALGLEFGVTHEAVSALCHRRTWRHVA